MIKCNKFITTNRNLNEMEFSMKSVKGLLFIIASFILTLLTWMNTSPQFMIPGLALTSLSLTFILATRLPLLESWFHGFGEGLHRPQIHSLSLHHPTNLS